MLRFASTRRATARERGPPSLVALSSRISIPESAWACGSAKLIGVSVDDEAALRAFTAKCPEYAANIERMLAFRREAFTFNRRVAGQR